LKTIIYALSTSTWVWCLIPSVSLTDVVKALEELVEEGSIDDINIFLVFVMGYLAYLWRVGLIDGRELSKLVKKLMKYVTEFIEYVDKDVIELMSVLGDELNEVSFREFLSRLIIFLREPH